MCIICFRWEELFLCVEVRKECRAVVHKNCERQLSLSHVSKYFPSPIQTYKTPITDNLLLVDAHAHTAS